MENNCDNIFGHITKPYKNTWMWGLFHSESRNFHNYDMAPWTHLQIPTHTQTCPKDPRFPEGVKWGNYPHKRSFSWSALECRGALHTRSTWAPTTPPTTNCYLHNSSWYCIKAERPSVSIHHTYKPSYKSTFKFRNTPDMRLFWAYDCSDMWKSMSLSVGSPLCIHTMLS